MQEQPEIRIFAPNDRPAMHYSTALLTLALLAGSYAFASCGDGHEAIRPQAATDTTAWLVMQVNRCSRLYTAEMQIHKLVTHSDDVRLKGRLLSSDYDMRLPVGDRKAVVPIDVTLKAYVDLGRFDSTCVARQGRRIVLTLPDPVVIVTASKVDHRGVRQYVDPLRSRYTDVELSDMARQGVDTIVSHIGRYGLTEAARQSATRTLVPLLTRMGYDEADITVRFRPDLTADDLRRSVELRDGNTRNLKP